MKKKLLVISYWLLVFFFILPSILPLFRNDFFRMHDYTHVTRLYELDKALKEGHFPVRWSKDLGWGFGMPLFNFYAPFPYYFSEIFHLIGFSFLNSIKIGFGLTFFISFLGMFLLAKKFWGPIGGFLSAVAFVYSPYRAVDFYVRGALGELFAIALIPWAIWIIFELIEKKTLRSLALSALIMASLFLSHTVLTLICLPTLVIISLFYLFVNKNKLKGIILIITSFILAIGLSAFFLIPAFFEKDFTRVDQLTQGFSHYGHHFLYFRQFLYGDWGYGGSVDGIEDGVSFHLGKGHLLLSLMTLIFSFMNVITKKKIKKEILVIGFLTALTLTLATLTTYHAKPVWDAISIMAFIQFPWRFNSLLIVFIGFLAGGGYFYLKKVNKTIALLFVIMSILMVIKVNVRYFRPEKYLKPGDLYSTEEILIKKNISSVIPDYIPTWVKEFPQEPPAKEYEILEGDVSIELVESKTHQLVLKAKANSLSKLQLNRFYFPGWQLMINDNKQEVNYQDNNGIIYFSLPKGDSLIKLKFKNTFIRNLANVITVISFFITNLIILKKTCILIKK